MSKVIEKQSIGLFGEKRINAQKKLIKTFKIKTQKDFSQKYFPECEINENGFALPKKDLWYYVTGRFPYGPLDYWDGCMSLSASASFLWDGRVEKIKQWNFQNDLVEKGIMRKH